MICQNVNCLQKENRKVNRQWVDSSHIDRSMNSSKKPKQTSRTNHQFGRRTGAIKHWIVLYPVIFGDNNLSIKYRRHCDTPKNGRNRMISHYHRICCLQQMKLHLRHVEKSDEWIKFALNTHGHSHNEIGTK